MLRQIATVRPAIAALALFGALALLFFWRLFAPVPADHATIGLADGDFLRQFYPYRVFVARTWASGQVPAWNPHQYGGAPAWADPQYAVLYPWRWLQALHSLAGDPLPVWAVELEAVVHVALGGWFVFLLARRLGATAPAAFFAGSAFGFGGYLTGYPVEQLAVLDTAVWIPLGLLFLTMAVDAAAESRMGAAFRAALAAGAVTALSAFAGHPQTAVYGLYLGIAWLVARAWRDGLAWSRALSIAAVWLGLGAALSAAQWLPSAELMLRADRAVSARELSAGFRVADLWQMVAPPPQRVVDEQTGREAIAWAPLFVGSLPLLLAAWGVRRVRDSRFFAAAAAVGWVLALGGANPLFPLLVRVVPGLSLFRHQERFAVIVSLGLAVAAGLALARAVERTEAARVLGRAALAAALAAATAAAVMWVSARPNDAWLADALALTALALGLSGLVLAARGAGRLGAGAAAGWLTALLLLELFSVQAGRALGADTGVWARDELVDALAPRARDGRISSEALLPGGPNAATVFGLYDVTGDNVLRPADVARLEAMPEIVRWRLLGVRYVVSDRAFPAGSPVREIARLGERALYEVLLPGPPVWVPAALESRAAAEMADWVPAPDFDPLAVAPIPAAAAAHAPAGAAGAGSATLSGLEPGRARVEARLEGPGAVVLSTVHDPGWRARARAADGAANAAVDVFAAYGVLPAVLLAAGDWVVEWTYRPLALHLGVSLSTVAMLLGVLLWRRSRATRP